MNKTRNFDPIEQLAVSFVINEVQMIRWFTYVFVL